MMPGDGQNAALADLFSSGLSSLGKEAVNVGRGCLQGLKLGVDAIIQEHRSRISGQGAHTCTKKACVSVGLAGVAKALAWAWRRQRRSQFKASWCVSTAVCCIPEFAGHSPGKWAVP